uniref:Uncharacterized protein n=1 Tax=Anguilla anguilla TaxID=7936 RepID=A0A0E9VE72_ANGAN
MWNSTQHSIEKHSVRASQLRVERVDCSHTYTPSYPQQLYSRE